MCEALTAVLTKTCIWKVFSSLVLEEIKEILGGNKPQLPSLNSLFVIFYHPVFVFIHHTLEL